MSNRYFPFHALGFRCNPFRTLTDDEWAEIAVLPHSVNCAVQNGFAHLQILGERGFGKTTTLLALAALFKRSAKRVQYEYLPEGQSHFKTNGDALDVFLLDEAQRLDPREQERLVRLAPQSKLVLASHADFTTRFASHHLELATVRLDDSSNEHLRTILSRRLDYFRLNEERNDNPIDFSQDAIEFLAHTFRGNLRAMEQFLYEVFQRIDRIETVTAERLEQS